MKGKNTWSYAPYQPLLWNGGDIYICRLAPGEDNIHFEWLGDWGSVSVYVRERGAEEFSFVGTASGNSYDITDLAPEADYELYISSGEAKSRVRLARTGKTVGTVVNYLHPEDKAYNFSGRYLCSPSLVRHPEGYLLASMDLFAGGYPQNLTLIFRSDDNGATWHYVSELMPCFWGKLFVHKGELYMLSCSTEYGDLLIGKSTDGGKTFSAPVTLLRGSNGKNGNDGVHKNPQNMVVYNGRLYGTLEWGSWSNPVSGHSAMVMSCAVDDDLLMPENWSFSYPVSFDYFTPELSDLKKPVMTIEGTLAVSPEGKLLNIMRFGKRNNILAYRVNTDDLDAPVEFDRLIHFEANFSKFMIKYDEVSKKYYSVATRLYEGCGDMARNLLSLMSSPDLEHWTVACDILDYRTSDSAKVGFQYVDFDFDGDDIIFLCRTAFNNAASFHDSNYSTFHRIKDFRSLD